MHIINRSREFLSIDVSRTRTLRSNFLWNAVGNCIFSICQWGILVVFAKLGSPSLVGRLVYGLALTTPVFVVSGMQLRSIQATDAERRFTVGQYNGLRIATTIAALSITLTGAVVAWTLRSPLAAIIVFWALSKAVDSGSDTLYGLFQRSERMDYVGLSLTLRGLSGLATVMILFRFTHSVPIALAGLTAGWSAIFLLCDMPWAHKLLSHDGQLLTATCPSSEALCPSLSLHQLKALFADAVPLGVVAFLLAIQVQVPRYVVAGVLHTRELGLFSAAAYITFIGSMLVNALGAPACVHLAKHYLAGDRTEFNRLMNKLFLVAGALGLVGILTCLCEGHNILALLYTKEYSGMAGVLTILCLASALSFFASFLGYAMTALRHYTVQVPISICVVCITLLSCYYLTRTYGLMGTALGVTAGNASQLLMTAVVVWKSSRWTAVRMSATECSTVKAGESVS